MKRSIVDGAELKRNFSSSFVSSEMTNEQTSPRKLRADEKHSNQHLS